MDPLTQGLIGTAATQLIPPKQHLKAIMGLGFLSGMAADLDVLIRSSHDPLLFLEYHRQFTHSLIFIPLGGLICAFVLYKLFAQKNRINFKTTWLYCTLGYATHGLLDTCTSYGTQLFWPFSNERFAWNIISIIDPLYTVPIFGLLLLKLKIKKPIYAQLALIWVFAYPIIGLVQRERAESFALESSLHYYYIATSCGGT